MEYGQFIEAGGVFSHEMKFLSKATGKGDTCREYLKYILIEESDKNPGLFKGVATDRRRLHITDPLSNEIRLGFWKILRITQKTVWITQVIIDECFLEYKKILPVKEPAFNTKFYGIPDYYSNNQEFVDFIRSFPEPTVFRFDHLKDLTLNGIIWDVKWWSNNKSVSFEYENLFCLIMPMTYEGEKA
jgi:hypothetical protein